MKAQEKYDFIWERIKEKIEETKEKYNIPFELQEGTYYEIIKITLFI